MTLFCKSQDEAALLPHPQALHHMTMETHEGKGKPTYHMTSSCIQGKEEETPHATKNTSATRVSDTDLQYRGPDKLRRIHLQGLRPPDADHKLSAGKVCMYARTFEPFHES